MIAEHPAREEIDAFGQGKLDPDAAAFVEQHLSTCATCCGLLEGQAPDSFVGRLRESEALTPNPLTEAGYGTATDMGAVTEVEAGPPELVGHPRYQVLGLIGQGGMGAVYKALHRRMDRLVALKVIHPDLLRQKAAVQRFEQEVRTAARLQHRNIVTSHDADEAADLHFLVMEYLEGKSLDAVVQENGPLPIARACDFIAQAALGLQHAHEQGMVHRDIKPQNLMVVSSADGTATVKVLDFGLARFAHGDDAPHLAAARGVPLTAAGAVMGTADYIAPEQAADSRQADIRSDIYSLGCTLFFALTGRAPFAASTVKEKLALHAQEVLPPLAEVRADASPALAEIVARMTAKNPAQRYQTPADVAEALAAFARSAGGSPARSDAATETLDRSSVVQPPASRAGEPPAQRKSRRRRFALAASLTIAVCALAYFFISPVRDFANTLIRIATNRGELVIEADDEDIEIVIRQAGKEPRVEVIQKKSKRSFVLSAADGEIVAEEIAEGKKTGLRLKTTEFQLSRGDRRTLTAQVLLAPRPEPGFEPLFNGKDLKGWVVIDPPEAAGAVAWSVADNALTSGEGGEQSLIHTAKAFENYVLQMEFRFPKLVAPESRAAALLVHLNNPKKEASALEMVIASRGRFMLQPVGGAQGGEVTSDIDPLPHGQWHSLKVACERGVMEVFINGKSLCTLRRYDPKKGFIALQHRAPGLQFRNILIKELPPGPAGNEGFRPLFNAKDLTGWSSSADNYFVKKDGSLLANPVDNEFGMLRTMRPYENYELRFQCRVAGAGSAGSRARAGIGLHITNVDKGPTDLRHAIGITLHGGRTQDMQVRVSGDVGKITGATAHKGGPADGLWNDFRILCLDQRVTIFFNGELRWSCSRCVPSQGHIGLWALDGDAFFRNIEIKELSPETAKEVRRLSGDTSPVVCLAFASDKLAVTGGGSNEVHVWDVTTGKIVRSVEPTIKVPAKAGPFDRRLFPKVTCLAVAAAGKRLAVGGTWLGVQVWDALEPVATLGEPSESLWLSSLSFSGDGRLLLACGKEATLWDVAKRKVLQRFPTKHQPSAAVLSTDGRWVLTANGSDDRLELWDAKTGEEVRRFKGHENVVVRLALSPDGALALTSSQDETVRLWNVATGEEIRRFRGHDGFVNALAFSKDGKRALSAGVDTTIRLWDVTTGKELHRFTGHTHAVNDVAFSPDGEHALSAGGDGTPRLWRLPAKAEDASFRALFNGKDLTGWEGDTETWTWKDGKLVGDTNITGRETREPSFLVGKKPFRDFELTFRASISNHSGIFCGVHLRGKPTARNYRVLGPTLAIARDIGGFYTHWPIIKTFKPAQNQKELLGAVRLGDNDFFVRCQGRRVTVRINGVTTFDEDCPDLDDEGFIPFHDEGVIAFQVERFLSGFPEKRQVVTIQDVKIRELPVGPAADFRPLYNGTGLGAWTGATGDWTAAGAELTATGPNPYLAGQPMRTKEAFDHFELILEYCLPDMPPQNAYVLVHASESAKSGVAIELRPGAAATITNRGETTLLSAASNRAEKLPGSKWNELRIVGQGEHISAHINGETHALARLEGPFGGYIALMADGKTRFRNIRVKSLPPPKPEPLFSDDGFTGLAGDMTQWGWERLTTPKPGPGVRVLRATTDLKAPTRLWTRDKFGDFELEFDARLPTLGDLRVLVRGQKEDFAKKTGMAGMHVSFEERDPRLWGQVDQLERGGWRRMAVARGTEAAKAAKPDELNHFRIRCVGKRLTVEVNNVVTLDETIDKLPSEGVIGLRCTRAAEFTFRNIRLRKLPPPEPVFQPLFNNSNLDGWKAAGKAKVDGGEVVLGPHTWLESVGKTPHNFHLRTEVKLVRGQGVLRFHGQPHVDQIEKLDNAHPNNGWFVTLVESETRPGMVDAEMYLQVPGQLEKYWHPRVLDAAKLGESFTLEVVAQDRHDARTAEILLNGKKVMFLRNADFPPTKGVINLWNTGFKDGEFVVRKIDIRELPPLVAAEPVFQPIFNGKDFTGWVLEGFPKARNVREDWPIEDNAVECFQRFGILRTKRAYAEYELKTEFMFPQSHFEG